MSGLNIFPNRLRNLFSYLVSITGILKVEKLNHLRNGIVVLAGIADHIKSYIVLYMHLFCFWRLKSLMFYSQTFDILSVLYSKVLQPNVTKSVLVRNIKSVLVGNTKVRF